MQNMCVKIINVDKEPVSTEKALQFVSNSSHGATAIFLGTVRNIHEGRQVQAITYDVFEPLAIQSFSEICTEAQERWGENLRLYVAHGKGRIEISGASVVIAVSSPHRDEAFVACRYIIEQIKQRSPIWKLEHYIDGDSDWVKGHTLRPAEV